MNSDIVHVNFTSIKIQASLYMYKILVEAMHISPS
jgi:hypothetical protein